MATDGGGAYDKLTSTGNVWTWTDGDSQIKETYQANGAHWRLTAQADTDGNTVSFSYDGNNKLAQVTTASGPGAVSTLTYTWSGNNLMQVVTGYTDLPTSTPKTLTRTSYTYDANRLKTVTVDLSPGDNSVADGQIYVTTYAYVSDVTGNTGLNRIASIGQSDGSLIQMQYDAQGRVGVLTQNASTGVTRITSVAYVSATITEVTDPLGFVTRLEYEYYGDSLLNALISSRPDAPSPCLPPALACATLGLEDCIGPPRPSRAARHPLSCHAARQPAAADLFRGRRLCAVPRLARRGGAARGGERLGLLPDARLARTPIPQIGEHEPHVHLIVVPADPDGLRRTFRHVHRHYTGYINARMRVTGHLWQGRFSSVAMDEAHLVSALRYVALNPVSGALRSFPARWRSHQV